MMGWGGGMGWKKSVWVVEGKEGHGSRDRQDDRGGERNGERKKGM